MSTSVVQVTNISPVASSEQLTTLFSFLGEIEQFRVFPSDNSLIPVSSRVCYIKYHDPVSVGVAQHLTNVVFIDRGLIVVPFNEGKIPDESKALSLLAPATSTGLIPGAGLLPVPTSNPLASITTVDAVVNTMGAVVASVPFSTLGAIQAGLDPTLTALGISSQPPTMGNVDPSKIEEIRRTIYVGNLNSQTTTADQLLEFFSQVGEVKFVRMAGDETQPTRFAFVEFAEQSSVLRALAFNGAMFGDRPLKINHSNNAIVKPPEMTPQAAAKELEEVMKRVREAQSFISAVIEPVVEKESDEKNRRSRSRKKRSRSSSKQRCSRSRSQHRSPSRHKDRCDSKSPHKKRSQSKDKCRSQSCSPSREKTTENDSKGKEENKDGDYGKKKEKKSCTPPGRNSLTRRSRSSSREKYRKKSRSLSRKRSKSPRRRSRSPRRRSRSPKRKSRSPRRRSRSPRRRSRSPRRRSRSPRRRSRSPKRKSRSPKRKSRSPRRKSRSPRRKSRSPRRKSRSPRRRSRSPRRRSRSPRRRSRSPRRRSRSPRRMSRSPRRMSRSPRRRPRTPKRRFSRSPSPRRSRKEKRKDKERGHSKDRVENRENSSSQNQDRSKRDHSTSKKKKDKDKDSKIKLDKTDIKMEGDCNNEEEYNSDKNKENTETSSEVLANVKENGDHSIIHQNTEEAHKSEDIPLVITEEENGTKPDMLSTETKPDTLSMEAKPDTLSMDLNDLQNKSVSLAEVDCP